MKNVRRTKCLITLVLIFALIVLIAWFGLGRLVKKTIETTCTRIVGAPVTIADVSLSFYPVAVTLNKVLAADPDEPMSNLLEIKSIHCLLDASALLHRRWIVNTMDMDGMQFNTRNHPGEIVTRGMPGQKTDDRQHVSSGDFESLSALLFGQETKAMVDQGLSWYNRLQPWLRKNGEERVRKGNGNIVTIPLPRETTLPGFLIRHTTISMITTAGLIKGDVNQITNDQSIMGIPMTFGVSGEGLNGISDIKINGVIDRVTDHMAKDRMIMVIRGVTIKDKPLGGKSYAGIRIEKGMADVSVAMMIRNGTLEGAMDLTLSPVVFKRDGHQTNNRVDDGVFHALSRITHVNVHATVMGTVSDYTVSIRSDCDDIVKKAAIRP